MTNWYKSLIIDGYGNIYITGECQIAGSRTAYSTLKYDPNGVFVWESKYTKHEYLHCMPTDIVADDEGNVFVTGWGTSEDNSDYMTVKYDKSGQEIWAVKHSGNGVFYNYDIPFAIALDDDGSIYVTGHEEVDCFQSLDYDIATIKYSPSGEKLWVKRYGENVVSYCWAGLLNVDDNRHIIITGTERTEDRKRDIITIV